MSKKPKLHLCIDRIIPIEHKIVAATLAIDEYPGNQPRMPRALAGASAHPAKMALLAGKKWQNGRELGVYFHGRQHHAKSQGAPVRHAV